MTERIEPLVPGKRDRLDIALGWIARYKKRRDKQMARVEAARASDLFDLEYVAQLALTMVHAPQVDRQRCADEITHVMEQAGHWEPKAVDS